MRTLATSYGSVSIADFVEFQRETAHTHPTVVRYVGPLYQITQNIFHFPHWLTFSFDRGSYEFDEPIHVEGCRGGALHSAIAAYLRRKEARMVQLVVLRRTNTLVHWT